MSFKMSFEGADKLVRKMQMIALETAKTHMRESALEAAKVIEKGARDVLNSGGSPQSRTGRLAESITTEVVKQTRARVDTHIGPSQKAFYGPMVEEGHPMVVKKEGIKVKIGDVPPHPFMRPALDEHSGAAQKAFEKELRRRLKAYDEGE